VSQGGDIAFIYGVLKVLVAKGGINKEFIEQHTAQWEELESRIAQYTFAELESQAGLPQASMEAFADLLMTAHNAVFVWSMGITQHAYGGDAVSMVLNLGLARGYVGREKTGLVPIRGHSSVQGGAEMGCYATALPGGVPVTEENCRKLGEHYGFPIPTWPGYNSVEMVQAAGRGELDVLYCLGGNFLRTLPNPADVVDALSRVPLRVYQDILVNDQMLMEPNETVLLLPAKTRYEQDDGGTETTTERRILFSPELPRELGEVRAEWKILHQVAAATYPDRAYLLGPADGWALRTEIAHVVPFYDGVQHLKKIGDAIQYGGPRLCDNGQFPTTDGKAHFKAISLPPQDAPGLISKIEMRPGNNDTNSTASDDAKESHVANSQAPKQPQQVPVATPTARRTFMVSTRRGKQFNSLVYAEIDPLNGAPRDAVLMHDTDAAALGLSNGQQVVLKNAVGRYAGRVFLAPIAPGNLQVHWPEGNVILASDVTDPVGGVPDYNARVEVEPI
jgi:anaerobic selenocysteine-containing dehydrogenase